MSHNPECFNCGHLANRHATDSQPDFCRACVETSRPFLCSIRAEHVSANPPRQERGVAHHVPGHAASCRCSGCKAETLWAERYAITDALNTIADTLSSAVSPSVALDERVTIVAEARRTIRGLLRS